eukprot:3524014-Ditylum_brightwellii.AAC.1
MLNQTTGQHGSLYDQEGIVLWDIKSIGLGDIMGGDVMCGVLGKHLSKIKVLLVKAKAKAELKEEIAMFAGSLNDGQYFFFHCCVILLCWIQFVQIKRDWKIVLHDAAAKLKEGSSLIRDSQKLDFSAGRASNGLNSIRTMIPELLQWLMKPNKVQSCFRLDISEGLSTG